MCGQENDCKINHNIINCLYRADWLPIADPHSGKSHVSRCPASAPRGHDNDGGDDEQATARLIAICFTNYYNLLDKAMRPQQSDYNDKENTHFGLKLEWYAFHK